MAFTPDTLSLVVDSIGGSSLRMWFYITPDNESVVMAPDYMVGAHRLGVRDGHIIAVYDTVTADTYMARVLSMNANGDASLAADRNFLLEYDTVAAVEAAHVPIILNALRVKGYYAAGDLGGAMYRRVLSEPSHGMKIQSADGAWWEFAEDEISMEQAGARNDNSTPDDAALDRAYGWCMAQPLGGVIRFLATGSGYLLAEEHNIHPFKGLELNFQPGAKISSALVGADKVLLKATHPTNVNTRGVELTFSGHSAIHFHKSVAADAVGCVFFEYLNANRLKFSGDAHRWAHYRNNTAVRLG